MLTPGGIVGTATPAVQDTLFGTPGFQIISQILRLRGEGRGAIPGIKPVNSKHTASIATGYNSFSSYM